MLACQPTDAYTISAGPLGHVWQPTMQGSMLTSQPSRSSTTCATRLHSSSAEEASLSNSVRPSGSPSHWTTPPSVTAAPAGTIRHCCEAHPLTHRSVPTRKRGCVAAGSTTSAHQYTDVCATLTAVWGPWFSCEAHNSTRRAPQQATQSRNGEAAAAHTVQEQ